MIFPDAAAAASVPLHVLLRDFPETLALLRQAGLDVPALAGRPLSDGDVAGPDQLLAAMAAATAWRAAAPAGPCERAAAQAAAHARIAASEQAAAD